MAPCGRRRQRAPWWGERLERLRVSQAPLPLDELAIAPATLAGGTWAPLWPARRRSGRSDNAVRCGSQRGDVAVSTWGAPLRIERPTKESPLID